MIEFIRAHQLNVMLILCGACAILIFLLINTHFLSKRRKGILILMELEALLLLWFDRLAYIYAGNMEPEGLIMTRVSNFLVFFLTSGIVFGFNLYLSDLLLNEGRLKTLPKRLMLTGAAGILGMIMAVVSAFTDLYYYFDEFNYYQRGRGFLIAYIIPVLCPIIQYTVIRQYKKAFSKLIYFSLVLYLFVPILCGILQIFAYGISIVNMAMVLVSVFLYVFVYLDLNNEVIQAHKTEIEKMQGEQDRLHKLFDQTARAFVSAVEKKDDFTKGNAIRIAGYAKRIAEMAGKDEEYAEKAYYAALLHDVGMIGIPDSVIKNENDPEKWDYEMMRKKPLIGEEILSSITEYPYLSQGAHYSHERYNGTGYPSGLKGEEIPEIARIIAVADAYVTMTTKKRYRDARPVFVAREAFVKGEGEEFDPVFAEIMVRIIDAESNEGEGDNAPKLEDAVSCREYRENVTRGIPVERDIRKISFDYEPLVGTEGEFSSPSIVLFDSYDGRIHNDAKSVKRYHYLEYGEIWFDRNHVGTEARNMEEREIAGDTADVGEAASGKGRFEITAGRFEDHLKLVMKSESYEKEVIIALASRSKAAYIGITGENCNITGISVSLTGEKTKEEDIPRIASPVSYIEHLEGDVKNVQVDRWMSASTEGIEIDGNMRVVFHTMTLPEADLIWHVPYILLFYSDNGLVGGPDYRVYNMIKLNGEDEGDVEFAKNRFIMKKGQGFSGWETWKEKNKKGMECEVLLKKRGNTVILKTENLGISIEDTTTITDDRNKVYIALSGDQVALTDIRIEK